MDDDDLKSRCDPVKYCKVLKIKKRNIWDDILDTFEITQIQIYLNSLIDPQICMLPILTGEQKRGEKGDFQV